MVIYDIWPPILLYMLMRPQLKGALRPRGAAILYGIGIFVSYGALMMIDGFSLVGLVSTSILDGAVAFGFYTWADNNDNPLTFGIGFVVACGAMIAGGIGLTALRERLFGA